MFLLERLQSSAQLRDLSWVGFLDGRCDSLRLLAGFDRRHEAANPAVRGREAVHREGAAIPLGEPAEPLGADDRRYSDIPRIAKL